RGPGHKRWLSPAETGASSATGPVPPRLPPHSSTQASSLDLPFRPQPVLTSRCLPRGQAPRHLYFRDTEQHAGLLWCVLAHSPSPSTSLGGSTITVRCSSGPEYVSISTVSVQPPNAAASTSGGAERMACTPALTASNIPNVSADPLFHTSVP